MTMKAGLTSSARAAPPPAVAGQQRLPVVALVAALASALCAGLVLAIVLPSAAALSAPWGLRWRALAQVHGHIMVVGWVGFFIIGMATRLLPRFSSTPLQFPRCVPAAFALIAIALTLRSLAQPLADAAIARDLLPVSGVLESAGTTLFALSALATLRRPLAERRPFAWFLAAGAVWFVAQALLTTWALVRVVQAGEMVIAGADDAPILQVQFFGFLLCFIFGISLRSIPTFYAWRPPAWLPWAAWSLLQLGVAAVTIAALLSAIGADSFLAGDIGRLVLALALLTVAGCMGVWRPASRMRGGLRSLALLLGAAYSWLAVAALMLIAAASYGFAHTGPTPGYFDDAIRHILALGVISTMVIGMAYLVAPMFAQERTEGAPLARRVRAYAGLLGGAALLRAGGALLEGLGITSGRYWPMAMAGVLALAAVALFARRLVYGLRHPYVPTIPAQPIGAGSRRSRPIARD